MVGRPNYLLPTGFMLSPPKGMERGCIPEYPSERRILGGRTGAEGHTRCMFLLLGRSGVRGEGTHTIFGVFRDSFSIFFKNVISFVINFFIEKNDKN